MTRLQKLKKAALPAAHLLIPLSVLAPHHVNAQPSIFISATDNLNFGTLTTGGAGGPAVVSTNGVLDTSGGSVVPINSSGMPTQAVFSVAGSTGLAIDLSVTSPSYVLTNGAGATMVVDRFNLITDARGSNTTITLATGVEIYNLGARLNINAGQPAGSYVGNYTLNANYQ